MIKQIFANEKLLFASVSANGFLEWFRRIVISHQPELTAMLTILQIVVALLTVAHIVRKWIRTWKANQK